MKKIIKAALSGALVMGMLAAQCFSTSAMIRPIITGDVDWNSKVDVNDVTLLQNALAGSAEIDKSQNYAGDVNFNGVTNVEDVTLIQLHIAGKYEFERKSTNLEHIIRNFCADYDSGKAMTGTPVTFTATMDSGVTPFSYEFLINGEVVQQKSELNTFTYTFSESGSYDVSVRSYNAIDDCAEETLYNYTVVDAYESEDPVIVGIHTDVDYIGYDEYSLTISANAIFGTAPYQYKFTLDNGFLVQDYSESADFTIEMSELKKQGKSLEIGEHTVLVEVKDADGKTAQETFTFEVKEPRM
mgnify:FL=1